MNLLEANSASATDRGSAAAITFARPPYFEGLTLDERYMADGVRAALRVEYRVVVLPLLGMTSATGGCVTWKSARVCDPRDEPQDDIESRSATALASAALFERCMLARVRRRPTNIDERGYLAGRPHRQRIGK